MVLTYFLSSWKPIKRRDPNKVEIIHQNFVFYGLKLNWNEFQLLNAKERLFFTFLSFSISTSCSSFRFCFSSSSWASCRRFRSSRMFFFSRWIERKKNTDGSCAEMAERSNFDSNTRQTTTVVLCTLWGSAGIEPRPHWLFFWSPLNSRLGPYSCSLSS